MHKSSKRRRYNLKQGEDCWAPARNQRFYTPFHEHNCLKPDSGYCSVCRCPLFLSLTVLKNSIEKTGRIFFLFDQVNSAMHIAWTSCFQADYGMDSYIHKEEGLFKRDFTFFKKDKIKLHYVILLPSPFYVIKPFSENSDEDMLFSLKGQINTVYLFIWMSHSFVTHGVFTADGVGSSTTFIIYTFI